MILLIQGASYSLYTCHSIHIWTYFTWSSVLLLPLVFYLSVYINIKFIIHLFQCSTYIVPLLSHFHISVFSFHVCICWSASDGPWFFSIRAWGDRRATVRRNPGRLPGMSLKFFILCFLAFCLVMMSRCQNCIFFISVLLYFQSCIQTKTIVDECLLCEMKYLVVFCIYVCEKLVPLLQRKTFMEEISLFLSIY